MPERPAWRLRLSALPGRPLLVLDPLPRRVTLDDRDCAITGRAFDLLHALCAAPGQPRDAQALRDAVWPDRVVEGANLRAQVRLLRQALGAAAIGTVGRRGYVLVAERVGPGEPPEQVAQVAPVAPVATAQVRADVPPAADAPPGLVGRDADLAHVGVLLRQHRLVTLLGPCGVGKSRLARAVTDAAAAAGVAVTHVDLDGLRAVPDLAPPPAAGCLWLDNAEHLAAPGGDLARWIAARLEAAPGLRVLVTSRRPLGVDGEVRHAVLPLSSPPPAATPAALRGHPGVQLLLERAVAADQRFTVDDAEWPAIAAIVRLLDGLPLALEHAAARLPLLGARALAGRLQQPLQALAPAWRVRAGRHAGLPQVIDDSVAGLSPDERQALVTLSLFEGPFTVALAAALLCGLGVDRATACRWLQTLADHSLLITEPPGVGVPAARARLLACHRDWGRAMLAQKSFDGRRALQMAYVRTVARAAANGAFSDPGGHAAAPAGDLRHALALAHLLGEAAAAAGLEAALR